MDDEHEIEIRMVTAWDEEAIADLYRAGGWWKEGWDPSGIAALIRGSFAFAVAVDTESGRAIGMGRVLSDGIADAFIEDVVVLSSYRHMGIGTMIVSALLERCRSANIGWIVLIAEPGLDEFYTPLGFLRMEGYIPMRYQGDGRGA
ncbi:MAG: GNAT family N-acetyltransferase [Methanomicrobiaceae archaeon]|nr:GNAT family N-acetyltransferase [Methanomicrobiaceae archaeon]